MRTFATTLSDFAASLDSAVQYLNPDVQCSAANTGIVASCHVCDKHDVMVPSLMPQRDEFEHVKRWLVAFSDNHKHGQHDAEYYLQLAAR